MSTCLVSSRIRDEPGGGARAGLVRTGAFRPPPYNLRCRHLQLYNRDVIAHRLMARRAGRGEIPGYELGGKDATEVGIVLERGEKP